MKRLDRAPLSGVPSNHIMRFNRTTWVFATLLVGACADSKPEEPDRSSSTTLDEFDSESGPTTTGESTTTTGDIQTTSGSDSSGIEPVIDMGSTDCSRNLISLDDMVDRMRLDVFSLDEEDRAFTRYLTLTHMYNMGRCDDEIVHHSHAISKLVNSLSREFEISRPIAIDPEQTIFRIDIRDYGWDQNTIIGDVWEEVVNNNPEAIVFNGDAAVDLRLETETDVPFMPAHSFLNLSAQPPLYQDILELPQTLTELEISALGVDATADLDAGEAVRAGFADSGVSKFNRLIERHVVANNRSYWKSFDFNDDSGFSSLFDHPIDFIEAGGEMIFNLENGMQAYMISDGVGNRIDDAPVAVVNDTNLPDGVVRTGISCMGCHGNRGILDKEDEIRDFVLANDVLFSTEEREFVKDVHVEPEEFASLQQIDRQFFQAALTQAGVPIDSPEPILAVFLDYDEKMDISRVASEFGVTEDRLRSRLLLLDPTLKTLDDGGVISRKAFDAVYGTSLCVLLPGDDIVPSNCE